jgi:hypothetical protein
MLGIQGFSFSEDQSNHENHRRSGRSRPANHWVWHFSDTLLALPEVETAARCGTATCVDPNPASRQT